MNKSSIIIIFILIVVAFGVGIYSRDTTLKFFSNINKQVQDFKNTNIGSTLSQVGKELLIPPPLNIGGGSNQAILLQSKIISETNIQRQENGNLPALTENTNLDEAAAAKANDMFLNQYFEHISPTGVDPGKLVQEHGYDYIVAGENLILGNFSSEKEVVQDWMNSPGHRANILNNRFTEIGVAVIKGTYKGDTVWIGVQEFGLPLSTCSEPDQNLKGQIDLYKIQLDDLSSQINQKRLQIQNTNPRSASYNQMIDDYNQAVADYNSLAAQIKASITTYNGQINSFNSCVTGK